MRRAAVIAALLIAIASPAYANEQLIIDWLTLPGDLAVLRPTFPAPIPELHVSIPLVYAVCAGFMGEFGTTPFRASDVRDCFVFPGTGGIFEDFFSGSGEISE